MKLQIWIYQQRFQTLCDAMSHVLETGQGVILDRSAFSDRIFADANLEDGNITQVCFVPTGCIVHICYNGILDVTLEGAYSLSAIGGVQSLHEAAGTVTQVLARSLAYFVLGGLLKL